MSTKAVSAPPDLHALFERAEQYTRAYFAQKRERPEEGTIEVSGERYVLVRAASMSVEFVDLILSFYHEGSEGEARKVAFDFLFDLAHTSAKADARHFHQKFSISDPIEKLSLGPTHFAYTGWAFVNIDAASRPVPNENFLLIYDHPFSFESDAWVRRGRRSESPVCAMNAGYSSGWCEESFSIPLIAAEIACRAAGGETCRFVMAPPWRMSEHLTRYLRGAPAEAQRRDINVPEFFQRRRLEDKLRRKQRHIDALAAENARHEEEIRRLRAELESARDRLRALEGGAEPEGPAG
ncbi:V4R domain-containing protein [Sorangium sp. So ce1128]